MEISTLVLDWNGTVMDDLNRAWRVTRSIQDDLGVPPLERQAFREHFRLPLRRFLHDLGVPGDDLPWAVDQWSNRVREAPAPLSPGALAVLHHCKVVGINVGILTAADARVVRTDARHHGIQGMLGWVIGPSEDKAADLRRISLPGRSTVAFVGDTIDDVASARAARVCSVAYTRGYSPAGRLETAGADIVTDDLAELLPLLPGEQLGAAPPPVGSVPWGVEGESDRA